MKLDRVEMTTFSCDPERTLDILYIDAVGWASERAPGV